MKHLNTFSKGLNLDTDRTVYPKESYPFAKNLRMVSEEEHTSYTLSNIKETLSVTNGLSAIHKVVGLITVEENLIVFIKDTTPNSLDYICKVPIADIEDGVLTGDNIISSYTYEKALFDFDDEVYPVAKVESDTIKKVYWIDKNNPLRVINLVTPLNSQDPTSFNVIKKSELYSPRLHEIIGGSLKTGIYQYAYCLYQQNGSETIYSGATSLIPLSTSSLNETDSRNFRGSVSGEISGKGVRVIAWIDPAMKILYENIRLIRLYYSTQESSPEIDIVYEGKYYPDATDNHIILTDTGSVSLGTLTLEDYRYFPLLLSASTLETKNDYLLPGNVKESSFDLDVDMRAYRFNSSKLAYLYNDLPGSVTDTPDYTLDASLVEPTWDDIPSGIAPIQTCHNIKLDSLTTGTNLFMYQSDGATVGGEGKYISYRFNFRTRPINQVGITITGNFGKIGTNNFQDTTNPVIVQENLGYQRSEIYRFGIVFFDSYGRQSFVKWIGDIRFPDEGFSTNYQVVASSYEIKDLIIEFSFKQSFYDVLVSNDIKYFQIVRAERTYQDATVKDCGYGASIKNSPESNETNSACRNIYHEVSSEDYPRIVDYISPETYINKNNTNPYDRIDVVAAVREQSLKNSNTGSYQTMNVVMQVSRQDFQSYSFRRVNTTDKIVKIDYNEKLKYTSLSAISSHVYGRNFSSRFRIKEYLSYFNLSQTGTTLLLDTDENWINNGVFSFSGKATYIRRRSYTYPYGGYSMNALIATKYYPTSPVTHRFSAQPGTYMSVTGGDCFIDYFEYLRGIWSQDKEILGGYKGDRRYRRGAQIFYGLVESKINPRFIINPTIGTLDDGTIMDYEMGLLSDSKYAYLAMRETKGAYHLTDPDIDGQIIYEQPFDLYTYNSVYSKTDISKVYIMKPMDFNPSSNLYIRIYRSNRKINGENSDSWSKVLPNNFIDVDTKYGELVKLLNFNDRLMFFQEHAIGILSMEEKEAVSTSTGSTLGIGTGTALQRYDYITNMSGCNNPKGIINTSGAIYYIDTKNQKLALLGGEGVDFLSDKLGLRNFCKDANFTDIALLYNPNYNEVWWRLGNKTVSYNEYMGTFISFIDETNFSRSIFLNTKMLLVKGLYSFGLLEQETIYKPVELHILANPNGVIVNRYDSILVNSTATNSSNVVQDTTFSSVELSNDHQESPLLDFQNESRLRFRTWIFNNMRDSAGMRFYSDHLLEKFQFTSTDLKFKVHDIITNYEPINYR